MFPHHWHHCIIALFLLPVVIRAAGQSFPSHTVSLKWDKLKPSCMLGLQTEVCFTACCFLQSKWTGLRSLARRFNQAACLGSAKAPWRSHLGTGLLLMCYKAATPSGLKKLFPWDSPLLILPRVWVNAWFNHAQIHRARLSRDAGRLAAWQALLSGLLWWISHAKLCFKTSSFTFNQIPIIYCWARSVCDSWLYTHA